MYIYIYIERERERESPTAVISKVSVATRMIIGYGAQIVLFDTKPDTITM